MAESDYTHTHKRMHMHMHMHVCSFVYTHMSGMHLHLLFNWQHHSIQTPALSNSCL